MKRIFSIALALALCLCLSSAVFAAGEFTVTVINGMDGSVYDTFQVAEGEDFIFNISGSPPCDMGPIAEGDAGSGVTTTGGVITYSNVTLGGPNQYPTAETITVSEIPGDIEVTITPNPLEVGSEFPAFALGEGAAGGGSGEPSGEASGDASSDEPYPMFEEYKAYLLDTLLQDEFWQGNEEALKADLAAAATPDDANIQNFTGAGAVDQAPPGVVFPLTYDAWYAENAPADAAGGSVEAAFIDYIHQWLLDELEVNGQMTIEQVEDEFMPLVEQMNFTDFPAEMIYSGMLEQGVPMTFEEFSAQNAG